MRASIETDLRTALISAPAPLQLRCAELGPAFHQLWDRCDRLRGYTDCWVYVQAVRGAVDAVIEPHEACVLLYPSHSNPSQVARQHA